jgi:hypothetical protein
MRKLLFVFLLVPFLTIAQPSDPSGDPDKDIVEMVEETKDIIKKRIEEFRARMKAIIERMRKRKR